MLRGNHDINVGAFWWMLNESQVRCDEGMQGCRSTEGACTRVATPQLVALAARELWKLSEESDKSVARLPHHVSNVSRSVFHEPRQTPPEKN